MQNVKSDCGGTDLSGGARNRRSFQPEDQRF